MPTPNTPDVGAKSTPDIGAAQETGFVPIPPPSTTVAKGLYL